MTFQARFSQVVSSHDSVNRWGFFFSTSRETFWKLIEGKLMLSLAVGYSKGKWASWLKWNRGRGKPGNPCSGRGRQPSNRSIISSNFRFLCFITGRKTCFILLFNTSYMTRKLNAGSRGARTEVPVGSSVCSAGAAVTLEAPCFLPAWSSLHSEPIYCLPVIQHTHVRFCLSPAFIWLLFRFT